MNLIDYLIETYPVSDRPFLAPWIVVPNREFQEWIDREIAKKVGSSPHFNYVFPIEFIWKLYRLIEPDLPKKLPTDLHALSFKIFELLANNEQVKLLFGDLQDQSPVTPVGNEPMACLNCACETVIHLPFWPETLCL